MGVSLMGLALALTACGGHAASASRASPTQPARIAAFKHLVSNQSSVAGEGYVALSSDARGAKIDVGAIEAGCLVQDCIPSLIHPKFQSAKAAASWLHGSDVVFGLSSEGVHRAYPQRILNWHEIVNDTVKGTPVLITFCPLCGSALAFQRMVNGKVVNFGVSGLLYNSDLIMYDRREGSLWQQFTGQAIVGPAAQRNERLETIGIATTTWKEWRKAHPDSQVLSRDTGYDRNYDEYPYGTYELDDQIYFGIQHTDRRLSVKAVVYGVVSRGRAKAYPVERLPKSGKIVDTLGGESIVLSREPSGNVRITDARTGQAIIPLRTFWFAWAAFYPDTGIYGAGRSAAAAPGPVFGPSKQLLRGHLAAQDK